MKTTNPDITMGLHDLRELYRMDQVFVTVPMTDRTTVGLTQTAQRLVSQIGDAAVKVGIAAPAIFVMVEDPYCATPHPQTATRDKLRSLFVYFEEELEPALEPA